MSVIPIQERYSDATGKWMDYATYDTDTTFKLRKQKHVDIRNFQPVEERLPFVMTNMDVMTMDELNSNQMSDLESNVILFPIEPWSNGVVDYQADRNNWAGLTFTLSVGNNTTQSVLEI